jgi:hypothetical protein
VRRRAFVVSTEKLQPLVFIYRSPTVAYSEHGISPTGVMFDAGLAAVHWLGDGVIRSWFETMSKEVSWT